MNVVNRFRQGCSRRSVILLAVCGLFGCSLLINAIAQDRGPTIPRAEGEHCVADTDYMRRHHMDLLTHQRDDTVIRGIRGEPFSLVDCVDCHVQKSAAGEAIRIDEEGQFCQSCHAYAAVKIDCFGCHAAVPDQAALEWNNPNADLPLDLIETHLLSSFAGLSDNQTELSDLAIYRHGLNRLLRD